MMRLISLAVLCHCAHSLTRLAAPSPARRMAMTAEDGAFDPRDFEKAMKQMGPMLSGIPKSDSAVAVAINKIRGEQEARASSGDGIGEEIYRIYNNDLSLPVLNDCNNYFSGRYNDNFWHQNADQVYVYLPLKSDDVKDVSKNDVSVKFDATKVKVSIYDKEYISFDCLERIIPDGSFWTFETDNNNVRYLHMDLEKRFRMINWKALFGLVTETPEAEGRRKEMLEKLFAANKGMAKLTGGAPESMEDMMKDGNLMKAISSEVDPEPNYALNEDAYISDEDFDINDYIKKISADMAGDLLEGGDGEGDVVDTDFEEPPK